ncbi:lysophospholipid acyltransferase family protein [Parasphingorhabdus pacifica]
MTHQWMPTSPCGPGCVQRVPTVGAHRVVLRLSRAVCVLLLGTGLALVLAVLPADLRRRLVRGWYRALLRAFDVRFFVHGEARLAEGGLAVSNHVSWLDIAVLQSVWSMRLLAKSEVRSWPLVGALAARAGTLFIDRDRLRTLPRAVSGIADALREGSVVGVFPEGTTWCGLSSGRYRPAVFQAAVDAGTRVQPVALRYRSGGGDPTTVAAFVGEANLIESVLEVARARDLVVEMFLLADLDAGEVADRRELARRVEAATADVAGANLPASGHREEQRLAA